MTAQSVARLVTDLAEGAKRLARALDHAGGAVAVLTGAGMSTDSGIPDYRGVTGRARPASPMTYQEFLASTAARQRYWARSHLGWRTVAGALPNDGHRALAQLQQQGAMGRVITQNVDGLHQQAGAAGVIELHGALGRVVCLDCGALSNRAALESRLDVANRYLREFIVGDASRVRPDGDVTLSPDLVHRFRLVPCLACDGLRLKPDVVFFGESVPKRLVQEAFEVVEGSRLLLVLGSSLTVMSGYRFVRRAHRLGIAVLIVNRGSTRGDAEAIERLDLGVSELLTQVASGSGHGL